MARHLFKERGSGSRATGRRARSGVVAGVLALAASLLLLVASGAAEQTREAPKEALGGGFEGAVSSQVAPESAEPGTPAAQRDGRFTAFTDVSDLAGITATHTAQRSNVHETRIGDPGQEVDRVANYLVTGQAWGDYDGDGWVDLYVTNQQGPNTLYHNEGDGTFRISPLSEEVSLPENASGGAVFADYDNDGFQDLYVASGRYDTLFRNEGGQGFTDVTEGAGIGDGGQGITASWGDYDKDGYLDLYVVNRLVYDYERCNECGRQLINGARDRFYHNEGDGTFTDVTDALPEEATKGLGFVAGWVDYDDDSDLYLVNDVIGTSNLPPNALFRNDGPGCDHWCFTDVSEASGADVRLDGMGLAVGDYDGDQNLDLYMSGAGWLPDSITGPAVLLRNQGDGTFEDVSRQADVDVDAVGWGTVSLDYDNDGWQDLYVALAFDPKDVGSYVKKNRLLRNRGDGTFEDTSANSGASHADDTLGVATADYNNDGWTDLVAGNIDEGYDLYANAGTAGEDNHRLTVRLQGAGPVNRDAVGARVYLTTTGGRTQMREVMAGSSLGAGNDLALGFGLGEASVESLRVIWPDGLEQTFEEVPSDVLWQLSYGDEPSTSQLAEVSVPREVLEGTQQPISGSVRTGGYLVPVLTILATLGILGWLLARRLGFPRLASRILVALVLGVLTYQLVHFVEHILQMGYWFAHPAEPPWITPWGKVAVDGLAALVGRQGGRATGFELMHLMSNLISFTGIVAMYIALRSRNISGSLTRWVRAAFWLQLVHVLEHTSRTTTFFLVGIPIGMSTLFGHSFHMEGAWATTIHVWWHFLMAVIPTAAFLLALREFLRAWPSTTAATSTTAANETPEHERAAEIPVADRERHPSVGSGARNSREKIGG